jgi:hypothetical protein
MGRPVKQPRFGRGRPSKAALAAAAAAAEAAEVAEVEAEAGVEAEAIKVEVEADTDAGVDTNANTNTNTNTDIKTEDATSSTTLTDPKLEPSTSTPGHGFSSPFFHLPSCSCPALQAELVCSGADADGAQERRKWSHVETMALFDAILLTRCDKGLDWDVVYQTYVWLLSGCGYRHIRDGVLTGAVGEVPAVHAYATAVAHAGVANQAEAEAEAEAKLSDSTTTSISTSVSTSASVAGSSVAARIKAGLAGLGLKELCSEDAPCVCRCGDGGVKEEKEENDGEIKDDVTTSDTNTITNTDTNNTTDNPTIKTESPTTPTPTLIRCSCLCGRCLSLLALNNPALCPFALEGPPALLRPPAWHCDTMLEFIPHCPVRSRADVEKRFQNICSGARSDKPASRDNYTLTRVLQALSTRHHGLPADDGGVTGNRRLMGLLGAVEGLAWVGTAASAFDWGSIATGIGIVQKAGRTAYARGGMRFSRSHGSVLAQHDRSGPDPTSTWCKLGDIPWRSADDGADSDDGITLSLRGKHGHGQGGSSVSRRRARKGMDTMKKSMPIPCTCADDGVSYPTPIPAPPPCDRSLEHLGRWAWCMPPPHLGVTHAPCLKHTQCAHGQACLGDGLGPLKALLGAVAGLKLVYEGYLRATEALIRERKGDREKHMQRLMFMNGGDGNGY